MPQEEIAVHISAMELRRHPGRYLDQADYKAESFVIERAGQPKAALIPIADYRRLQAIKQEEVEADKKPVDLI